MVKTVNTVMSFFYRCTPFPDQIVSHSYIFLVIVNHSRTYYVPGTDLETDSNTSPTHPKPYVHVLSGNDMVT